MRWSDLRSLLLRKPSRWEVAFLGAFLLAFGVSLYTRHGPKELVSPAWSHQQWETIQPGESIDAVTARLGEPVWVSEPEEAGRRRYCYRIHRVVGYVRWWYVVTDADGTVSHTYIAAEWRE